MTTRKPSPLAVRAASIAADRRRHNRTDAVLTAATFSLVFAVALLAAVLQYLPH